MANRTEKDFLGEKEIPDSAYWGIHTQRGLENFPASGQKVRSCLIKALAMVKKACCLANSELGYLENKKSEAMLRACDEIIAGGFAGEFPLDALQGGAGTSTNMNVNEVVANRAIELLGGKKGDYRLVNPIEDVNLHQSTNDVYPTALKVACILLLRSLSAEIASLQQSFQQKEKEFAGVVKIGRTEMKEAVPITMGAEFSAFAEAIARDRWRTFKCEERIRVVNLGGTAVGTGLTAPRKYIFLATEKLREISGLGLSRAENMIDATANQDAFVEISGILKAHAANLIKIANDLRLMNLLGEIELVELAAGSSIMAGKVNPVMLEAVIQSGMQVIANDFLVTQTVSSASMQINEFMPLLANSILGSLEGLISVNPVFSGHINGLRANAERCREYLDRSPAIITPFLPHIGYDQANILLKEFSSSGKQSLRDFLADKLGKELVDNVLLPQNIVSLGYRKDEKNP
ncbi:MAG: aspartate ammonia-lyase [Candidatus Omnitrophica bacterium]|nr:aspartate ammonia-lyase [Candidatus Omnitrophota bacterium]